MMKKVKAFTLIELLIVCAMIGTLATIVIVSVGNAQESSRDSKRIADMESISKAIRLYAEQNKASTNYAYPFPDNVRAGYACGFPYDSANPDGTKGFKLWPGCLSGDNTFKGLVTEGYMPNLPKDPLFPSYRYDYFGGYDHQLPPDNRFALIRAHLETYKGSQPYRNSFRDPEGDQEGGWCNNSPASPTSEYCIKIRK